MWVFFWRGRFAIDAPLLNIEIISVHYSFKIIKQVGSTLAFFSPHNLVSVFAHVQNWDGFTFANAIKDNKRQSSWFFFGNFKISYESLGRLR